MLSPQDRRHLLEVLRPPAGYELSCAIGTTFSLDLFTLLTVPLAFTLFDIEDAEGHPSADPLVLLEAVRRHADHISIFCQAGRITIPKMKNNRLLSYLEDSVIEVSAPKEQGVFHPKIWILRFEGAGEPVRYRLLCLSRNLTFDRSWDTALVLEGDLKDRELAYSKNHPLGNFVKALPGMAMKRVPKRVQKDIQTVEYELRRVDFEPPEDFEEIYRFWPMGIEGATGDPFDSRYRRILVVSPFLSENRLNYLSEICKGNILVSRLESLDALDRKCLSNFSEIYVLDSDANPESEEPTAEQSIEDAEILPDEETLLSGLHAKLYIADSGWDSYVLTGSANATDAAFKNNVEFLVELRGKKSRCGIDAFLKRDDREASLRDLLREYVPREEKVEKNAVEERLEEIANAVRVQIVRAGFVVKIASHDEKDAYSMQLVNPKRKPWNIPQGAGVKCWPITLQETTAISPNFESGIMVDFGRISFEGITPFIAFEIHISNSGKAITSRFVLNLALEGGPTDRRDRLLKSMIKDKDQFIRFLLLLLYEGGGDFSEGINTIRDYLRGKTGATVGTGNIFVFETLIRTLERNPGKLDQIAKLIEDLCKTTEGKECLPEGFEEIWRPIWAVREEIGR